MTRGELLATCRAWARLVSTCYQTLDANVVARVKALELSTAQEMRDFLDEAIARVDDTNRLRLLWKIGPDLLYAGVSKLVAADTGVPTAAAMLQRSDFDPAFSWGRQAAKYRRDDLEVMRSGIDQLEIIERQDSDAGTVWLSTSKTAIRDEGLPIGVMLVYETITARDAQRRAAAVPPRATAKSDD